MIVTKVGFISVLLELAKNPELLDVEECFEVELSGCEEDEEDEEEDEGETDVKEADDDTEEADDADKLVDAEEDVDWLDEP